MAREGRRWRKVEFDLVGGGGGRGAELDGAVCFSVVAESGGRGSMLFFVVDDGCCSWRRDKRGEFLKMV